MLLSAVTGMVSLEDRAFLAVHQFIDARRQYWLYEPSFKVFVPTRMDDGFKLGKHRNLLFVDYTHDLESDWLGKLVTVLYGHTYVSEKCKVIISHGGLLRNIDKERRAQHPCRAVKEDVLQMTYHLEYSLQMDTLRKENELRSQSTRSLGEIENPRLVSY